MKLQSLAIGLVYIVCQMGFGEPIKVKVGDVSAAKIQNHLNATQTIAARETAARSKESERSKALFEDSKNFSDYLQKMAYDLEISSTTRRAWVEESVGLFLANGLDPDTYKPHTHVAGARLLGDVIMGAAYNADQEQNYEHLRELGKLKLFTSVLFPLRGTFAHEENKHAYEQLTKLEQVGKSTLGLNVVKTVAKKAALHARAGLVIKADSALRGASERTGAIKDSARQKAKDAGNAIKGKFNNLFGKKEKPKTPGK